jgi:hypothetical protein
MKITTNKQDFTGEEITVNVNKAKKSFKLYNEPFKLERVGKGKYSIVGVGWENPLGKIFEDENVPGDLRCYAWNDELERYGSNIYESAVRLLCNII